MAVPRARILVADDERNIRKNLALVLEAAGHAVDQAKGGEEALDLCKQNHPDLAFVDLHMPKMEGLKALAHIRVLSPKTEVRDIILTSFRRKISPSPLWRRGLRIARRNSPFEKGGQRGV